MTQSAAFHLINKALNKTKAATEAHLHQPVAPVRRGTRTYSFGGGEARGARVSEEGGGLIDKQMARD